jgi:uncharacterized protein YkwD
MIHSKFFNSTLKASILSVAIFATLSSNSVSAIYEMKLPNQVTVNTVDNKSPSNSNFSLQLVRADGSNSSTNQSSSNSSPNQNFLVARSSNSNSYSTSTSTVQFTGLQLVSTNGSNSTPSTNTYVVPSSNSVSSVPNGSSNNGIVTYNNLQPNYQTMNFGTPVNGSCPDSFNQEMLRQINDFRRQNGVGNLSLDSKLNDVACKHSWWMNNNNKLDHYGIDGTNPFQRCERGGTSCNAENVAYHSAKDLNWMMEFFRNSPSHRANMLNPTYTKVGIGMGNIYATQLFAE